MHKHEQKFLEMMGWPELKSVTYRPNEAVLHVLYANNKKPGEGAATRMSFIYLGGKKTPTITHGFGGR